MPACRPPESRRCPGVCGPGVAEDALPPATQRRTGRDNRPNYSGKHHRHCLHFLALTDERGKLIWISAARPGRTHDATAARRDKILDRPLDAWGKPVQERSPRVHCPVGPWHRRRGTSSRTSCAAAPRRPSPRERVTAQCRGARTGHHARGAGPSLLGGCLDR
ncbi:transposase family protein [Kitasatospora sp. NPDC017646]|uniref:transposase family protein n=1 Tax=Kitasatospora sp. NPDC017646 TaxID=3364024 RepID=UPI0037BE0393